MPNPITCCVKLPDLAGGTTYYLEEVRTSDGYNLLPNPVAFSINDSGVEINKGTNGKITTGSTEVAVDLTHASISHDDNALLADGTTMVTMYSIQIANEPGYKLPSTGGTGTRFFTITGLSLIVFAGVWFVISRRRRRV